MTMMSNQPNDYTMISADGDEVGSYALAGEYEEWTPCGHEGCDWAFEDGHGDVIRSHYAEHRDACLDITIGHQACEFCNVSKEDQIDLYLLNEAIEHPYCDPDAIGEDGDPSTCWQCHADIRGKQVKRHVACLHPDAVFCSISCLREFVAEVR